MATVFQAVLFGAYCDRCCAHRQKLQNQFQYSSGNSIGVAPFFPKSNGATARSTHFSNSEETSIEKLMLLPSRRDVPCRPSPTTQVFAVCVHLQYPPPSPGVLLRCYVRFTLHRAVDGNIFLLWEWCRFSKGFVSSTAICCTSRQGECEYSPTPRHLLPLNAVAPANNALAAPSRRRARLAGR